MCNQLVLSSESMMIYRVLVAYRRKHPSPFPRPVNSFSIWASSSSSSSSVSERDSAILKRLNHKDWLTPKEVLNIVDSLRNPASAITVLELYSNRKDYNPNETFYISIVKKLAQARMFDAIEDLMQRIKLERKCPLSEEFFSIVIKVYGNMAGRINMAIETLFDMPSYNSWPSVKTFNFVLNLLVSAKLFDVVHEVYTKASKLGVEIDACCLNILIKGLCGCGKLEAAYEVLDEFPKIGCDPNVRTFSTLMHALCEKGKVEEAFGLLDRMERDGICPDTITFNILIAGLRKQGRVEEGKEILRRMQLKGCKPSASSYQEVLYGLLDAERFVEAKQLMNRMVLEGISPSFVSYKMIIQGFCKMSLPGDVDWALKQMVLQGFVPKMGMWDQIVRSMVHDSKSFKCISYEDILAS